MRGWLSQHFFAPSGPPACCSCPEYPPPSPPRHANEIMSSGCGHRRRPGGRSPCYLKSIRHTESIRHPESIPTPVVALLGTLSLALFALTSLHAEDWPEWRGKGRRGEWDRNRHPRSLPRRRPQTRMALASRRRLFLPLGRRRTDLRHRRRQPPGPSRNRARARLRRNHGQTSLDARMAGRLQRHVLRQWPPRRAHRRRRPRLPARRRRHALLC